MFKEIYDYTTDHMNKSIDSMKKEFMGLRSGKVTTTIVDNIRVDYYGTPTPLTQVASVITTDATTITITPWEKNLLKEIEKSIQEANIGVNPNNDGNIIKLFFPPMTVEQRKETAKQVKVIAERAKVAVRNVRKDANDKIKKIEKDKTASEDDIKKANDHVQKITDDMIKKIDDLAKVKEDEILKV